MQSKRGRLDRYLAVKLQIHRKAVRELLLAERVCGWRACESARSAGG